MNQLLTYFVLAYLISWTIWLPLYGHIFGLNNLPTLPFNHAIGGLGPLIASCLTNWIFLKKRRTEKTFSKMSSNQTFYLPNNSVIQFIYTCLYCFIN